MNETVTLNAAVEAFRKRWKEEFDFQASFPRRREGRLWQGWKAYKELQQKGALGHANTTSGLIFLLAREVHGYKSCEKDISASNRCFNDAIEALSGAAARLRKTHVERSSAKPQIDYAFAHALRIVDGWRVSLQKRRGPYWEERLFTGEGWQTTDLDFEGVRFSELKPDGTMAIPYARSDDYEKWSVIFDRFRYPKRLMRRVDFDYRVQVRLGAILREHIKREVHHVSLSTISRLVLLCYIAGDLARNKGRKLVISTTDELVSVDAVEQRLRAAGLR